MLPLSLRRPIQLNPVAGAGCCVKGILWRVKVCTFFYHINDIHFLLSIV